MRASLSLINRRLANQKLVRSDLTTPDAVVAWLGAVQAQDYAGAKWAIGLRSPSLTDEAVDAAFNTGAILRTHVLRPTWHFVAPADIRWILSISAPRVHAANGSQYRRLELDRRLLARGHDVLERALAGRQYLTRAEIGAALARRRIQATGIRLAYIVIHAELEGLICSGPLRGKEFTYALLAERVPRASSLSREDALAELTRRYFQSHGPATLRDFVWWSGLTVRDARSAIETIGREMRSEMLDGLTYWFKDAPSTRPGKGALVHLLPNYDEYVIAYKNRQLAKATVDDARKIDVYAHFMVFDGRLAGTWRRTVGKDGAVVSATPLAALGARHLRALQTAAKSYGRFLGRSGSLTLSAAAL